MALKCIIKSGKSLCIDGPAALYTNSCFITLPSFQENAPTIQFINGALFPRLSPWILPTSSDLSTIIWTLWCFFNSFICQFWHFDKNGDIWSWDSQPLLRPYSNSVCKLLRQSSSWPWAPKFGKVSVKGKWTFCMIKNMWKYCLGWKPAKEWHPLTLGQQLPPAAHGLAGQNQSCRKTELY